MSEENTLPTYWRPEPRLNDWMFVCLMITCAVYVLGVILYGAQAMVATNGQSTWAQKLGSTLMVVGGEASTLFSVMEVFRKARTPKETHKAKDPEGVTRTVIDSYEDTFWDWTGIFVSLIATLGTLFVVFTRQTTIVSPWVSWTIIYGPLILLLCSGLDQYAAAMELGFLRSSFNERWNEWNDAKHAWIRTELARRDKLAREMREHELEMARESHEPHKDKDETRQDKDESREDDVPIRINVAPWRRFVQGPWRGRPDIQEARTAENGRQVELINGILSSNNFEEVPPSTARDWAKEIPPKE